MQAAGLQHLKLQIAAAFGDPQTRAFRGTELRSPKSRSEERFYTPPPPKGVGVQKLPIPPSLHLAVSSALQRGTSGF